MYFIDSLHCTYGPTVRISPTEISVNSVQDFKQIHSIKSGFTKSPWYETFTALPKPSSFSMCDKREHAARRKLFARAFSKTSLRKEWEGLVRSKCALAVERMGEESKKLGKVDIFKWWTFLASDILGQVAFGENFGSLERGEKNDFIKVLEKVMMGSGIRAELPLLAAVGRLIPTKTMQTLWNGRSLLVEYGSKAVETTRAQGESKNIFANVVAMADEGTEQLGDAEMLCEAVNFIIAGE